MKFVFLMLLLCFQLTNYITVQAYNTQLQYNDIKRCKNNEYYDLLHFKCVPCIQNNKILETSYDKFSCKCDLTFKEKEKNNNSFLEIPICQERNNICNKFYINATESKELKVYKIHPLTKNCSECDPVYNTQDDHFCISNTLLHPYLKYSYYWQSTSNSFLNGQLKFIVFYCLELRNMTACQHLANLCVLSRYSTNKNSPCHSFLMVQTSYKTLFSEPGSDFVQQLKPLLYYEYSTTQLFQEVLNATYNPNESLNLFSTTFKLDGSLSRMGVFTMEKLMICSINLTKIYFSKPMIKKCFFTIEKLIDYAQNHANNQYFNIYLNFSISSLHENQTMLQTLPILIEETGKIVKDMQLITRFLPIEAQMQRTSSLKTFQSYEDEYKLGIFQSINFIEHFELVYKIHEDNRISLPFIKLRYKHLEFRQNVSLEDVYVSTFAVTYISNPKHSTLNGTLQEIMLPLLIVIGVGVAILHTYNYKKRHLEEINFNCNLLIEIILQLSSQLAHAFLIYVVLHSSLLLFQHNFKNTEVEQELEKTFKTLINTGFILKLIFICIHLWRQSNYALFFIDWERPKVYNNNLFNLKCNLDTSSICSSARTLSSENSVSGWRMIHLANKWILLSGQQQISVLLQSILVLFIYEFLTYDTLDNTLLQTSLLSLIYFIIYVCQLICQVIARKTIFLNPLKQFAAHCSLSNISVLALLDNFSYGYYIHGRSPHGFADTDVCSLITQLQREPRLMRGLLNDSDQQHYLVLPPINLKKYFEKLFTPLQNLQSNGNEDRYAKSQSNMNRFLCAFIDHAIKDMDYIIKEKSLLEKIFNCEYEHFLTENKGTFYIDSSQGFGRLLLFGNELHISAFNLLCLLSIYITINNLMLALVMLVFINQILSFMFKLHTSENLFIKTNINKQLLL